MVVPQKTMNTVPSKGRTKTVATEPANLKASEGMWLSSARLDGGDAEIGKTADSLPMLAKRIKDSPVDRELRAVNYQAVEMDTCGERE